MKYSSCVHLAILLGLAPLLLQAHVDPPSSGVISNAGSSAANASLTWGTYRPNLYFGLKPRIPTSLITGLLWFGLQDYQSVRDPRHDCQERDGLDSYEYTQHDGRSAAVQVIKDSRNNVALTLSLLKVPGGDMGGSWAVRISGQPLDPNQVSRISLVNYFGNEGVGELELENDDDEEGIAGSPILHGTAEGLGDFTVRIVDDPTNDDIDFGEEGEAFGDRPSRTRFYGAQAPLGSLWEAKRLIMDAIQSTAGTIRQQLGNPEMPPNPAFLYVLPNQARFRPNLYIFQRTYQGTWSVDLFFDSKSAPARLEGASLTAGLAAASAAYIERFARTFALAPSFSASHRAFAQSVTSDVVGGIGYFYGSSKVDRQSTREWDEVKNGDYPEWTAPRELLTATPSRSFFPRGFYWDEGFHLLVIGAWDNDLSLEILKSWVDLIDQDGWVGREQILGEEARSRVPNEFQTQYPTYANPPTLTVAVTAYIARLRKKGISLAHLDPTAPASTFVDVNSAESLANRHVNDAVLAREYLTSIYAKLRLHYDWFRRTQRGEIKEWGRDATSRREGYRWRGRTLEHVLTSGLDDYPRAKEPHSGELHVDLLSWMAFFSNTMGEIAEFLGEEDDLAEFRSNREDMLANLEDLHWSETEQMYCDATVDDNEESIHVCHKGYVSLFPFLLGLLPADSPRLGPILDLVRDPEHLWSPAGIRSLSQQDAFYGQGENYWRGPVWIQMNYMALGSLYKIYAQESGPHQVRAAQIYAELRANVIENTHKEYVRTGYVWEQYNAETGEGQRSHPFNGWTSLVALIMAEIYP